jgi:hypothetical protein
MEIKITEVKSWIRGNKWLLLALILALAAGAVFFYITQRPIKPESPLQFPMAAISADISAARIDEIIQDINRQRSQEEEVIRYAKKKAVKAIADLDNDAVAAAWNARLGEYRERRQNQNGSAGNDLN